MTCSFVCRQALPKQQCAKVRKILEELVAEGKTFDIRADTPVDEIIQYFNSKGVYYEEPWQMHRPSFTKTGINFCHEEIGAAVESL